MKKKPVGEFKGCPRAFDPPKEDTVGLFSSRWPQRKCDQTSQPAFNTCEEFRQRIRPVDDGHGALRFGHGTGHAEPFFQRNTLKCMGCRFAVILGVPNLIPFVERRIGHHMVETAIGDVLVSEDCGFL